jgi:hypothetical protein
MTLTLNDQPITLPESLTLGQRIEFEQLYGGELAMMAKNILEMEDELEKDIELMQFQYEKAIRIFSFFTCVTLEAIRESDFEEQVYANYDRYLAPLFEDSEPETQQTEFTWQGETWVLSKPELKHGSSMQFGEVIDAKQVVKDKIENGAGLWEYMLPVCCIYLRKQGEDYDDMFLYEGSERMELMKSLPVDIAMHVIFFFASSTSSYKITSLYFSHRKRNQPGIMLRHILSDSDGSTFLNPLPKQKCLIYREAAAIA